MHGTARATWCYTQPPGAAIAKTTRAFLAEKNIPYVEYDIEKSGEGRHQYNELKGNGVPLLNVKGTLVRGYTPMGL